MKNQWTWRNGVDSLKKGVEKIKKIVLRKRKTSGDVAQILSDKDTAKLKPASAPYKMSGEKESQSHALNFSVNQEHLMDAISEQQRTIDAQQKTINRYENRDVQDSKTSQLLIAVAFASWGILSWTGAAIYWQISPESWVQESASYLAKMLSDEKTGYELIQEGKDNIVIIKKQSTKLVKCETLESVLNKIIATQDEIIKFHGTIIGTNESKIHNLSEELLAEQKKSELCSRRWKKQFIGNRDEEKQSKNLAGVDNSKIYATLSKLRSEIMTDFPDKNIEMKIQEQSGGWILVWMEYKGMGSLGFYADSIKNQNRLTKEGMSSWIQSSINQLLLVEQIQSVALSRNIGPSKNSFVSMEIKKLYTGNVTVVLSDSLSKKTGKFTVTIKKDAQEDISREIDKILEGFLSNAAWIPISEKTPQNTPLSDKNAETSLS
ncbi:MAG: hypothetical protein ACD_71C00193G0001 [uncultured bacterium (gcode 4)]|uniref:Uncharacterized protein n=1 Tax=uncultured bacterium (gcode 4) TaxID=1234023 RepID=K1ZIK1_9BACT|nr:MAG: hypothetical protein ACD_71C00193G0001 [uncultured bacterium (gcode 4)]